MTLLRPPLSPSTPDEGREPWRPRTEADLIAAQLRALDAWHHHFGTFPVPIPGQSREAQLDDARRRDVAERERAALQARAAEALRGGHRFGCGDVPRAVVAHRHEWLRGKVAESLRGQGVEIVLITGDGADAGAALVLEQPDIVFVGELLPILSGLDLIHRAQLLAPDALVGAHALGQPGMSALVEAGARATFTRRTPPADIASELVACLHGRHSMLTLV